MNESQVETIKNSVQKMAHDVRSPMTSILGFTQLMLGDESIVGDNREYLELMESDIEKLNKTILDTLETIEANSAE